MDEFTGKAQQYAQARPGYPAAALDFIASLLRPGAVVADIGAGTGKFTAPLAARGFAVIAIEPNDDMRGYLARIPGIQIAGGTAEATGLPDGSVDAVTCAQAFHWFDQGAFQAECRRILKPGGRIFVLYNTAGAHEKNRAHPELDWRAHKYDPGRWEKQQDTMREFFGGQMQTRRFDNTVHYDRAGFEAYMLSHSDSPRPGDLEYDRFTESVRAIYDHRNEEGKMILHIETVVYTE